MDPKIQRRAMEIGMLIRMFSRDNISYPKDLSHVIVRWFKLPDGLNQKYSSVLIPFPPGYGLYNASGEGPALRDIFLDPGLRAVRDGKHYEIGHYLTHKKTKGRNWQWLCLVPQAKWTRRESVATLLEQAYVYLSAPRITKSRR